MSKDDKGLSASRVRTIVFIYLLFFEIRGGVGVCFGTTCFLFEDTTAFLFKTKKEIIKPSIISTFLGEEESKGGINREPLKSVKYSINIRNKHEIDSEVSK